MLYYFFMPLKSPNRLRHLSAFYFTILSLYKKKMFFFVVAFRRALFALSGLVFGSFIYFCDKTVLQAPQFVWFIFLISRRTWHWLLFENSENSKKKNKNKVNCNYKSAKGVSFFFVTLLFVIKYIYTSFVYFYMFTTNICRISSSDKQKSREQWNSCLNTSCLSTLFSIITVHCAIIA